MKQYLPYNAVLVAAVVFTGLMIFYNLVMRETFAVSVSYKIPGVPQPQSTVEQVFLGDFQEEANGNETEEYYGTDYAGYEDAPALTSVTFPLDINRATEEELRFIPQVGSVMAQRIVQYRDVLGGYASLEQLKEIKGVGEPTYEKISAYLIITE